MTIRNAISLASDKRDLTPFICTQNDVIEPAGGREGGVCVPWGIRCRIDIQQYRPNPNSATENIYSAVVMRSDTAGPISSASSEYARIHTSVSRIGILIAAVLQLGFGTPACADKTLRLEGSKFPEERAVVMKFLSKEIAEAESMPNADRVQVRIAVRDLNNDSRPDILAFLDQYPYFCGTAGCLFVVLISGKNGKWKAALEDVVTQEDVKISSHSTRGYADLIITGHRWILGEEGRYAASKSR